MKISLLGVKWDRYQCFRSGSSDGIDMLREAMLGNTMELNIFSLANGKVNITDMYDTEVQDLGDVEPKESEWIAPLVKERLSQANGLPVILGGSHAITFGPVFALKPDNFVVFDAHADLYSKDYHEPEWMQHPKGVLSQENVTRCIHELGIPVHLFGVRTFAPCEQQYVKEHGIKLCTPKGLAKIKGSVYLSIDLDCLDPSIMMAVGNHEPRGLSFEQVVQGVRAVADKVVAVDFVEFTPFPDDATGRELNKIYARLTAKLVWAVLAEIKKARSDKEI
jgi:agmatinase